MPGFDKEEELWKGGAVFQAVAQSQLLENAQGVLAIHFRQKEVDGGIQFYKC